MNKNRNLYLICKEDLKNLFKNPMWLFFATLFPILLVLIMGFLVRDSYSKSITSFDFYGITVLIYSILTSGMTSANSFMEERIKKPNMRIIYAPGNERNIYLSKIIASFVFCFICHIVDIAIIAIFFKVHMKAVLPLLVLFAFAELFSCAIGVMMCCIFKTESVSNQILSIAINLFAVFGGVFLPLDGFGKSIQMLSYLSPAKWISTASFQLIYDNNYTWFFITLLILCICITIVCFVCEKNFRKEDCIC